MNDTTMNTGAASLSDEQIDAIKHLIARGSTFPDHNGRSGASSRVEYQHLQAAAPVLSRLLSAPTPQADAAIAAGGAQEAGAWHGCEPHGFAADCSTHTYAVRGLGIVVQASAFNALLSRSAAPLPRVAATVGLTDEQREAIEWAAGRAHVEALGKPIDGAEGKRWRLLSDMFRAAASNGEQA